MWRTLFHNLPRTRASAEVVSRVSQAYDACDLLGPDSRLEHHRAYGQDEFEVRPFDTWRQFIIQIGEGAMGKLVTIIILTLSLAMFVVIALPAASDRASDSAASLGPGSASYPAQAASKAPEAPGAGRGFLIDKHLKAKVECKSCHAANPPSKQTNWITTCVKCHGGDYNKLADKTSKIYPNPHIYHSDPLEYHADRPLPCNSCHHVHKASELYCDLCHEWKMKVP